MQVTGIDGLTEQQVQERVERGQVNTAAERTSRTVGSIIRTNVLTRFNAILGALLAIILVVGPLRDSLFGGVLVANTLIGIIQELRAKRSLDRLVVLSAPTARAVRSGRDLDVPVATVVLDDVLEFGPGDQVIADGVILRRPGRQPLDTDRIAAALKLVIAGLSPTQGARQLGLGCSTVYREVNRAGVQPSL